MRMANSVTGRREKQELLMLLPMGHWVEPGSRVCQALPIGLQATGSAMPGFYLLHSSFYLNKLAKCGVV